MLQDEPLGLPVETQVHHGGQGDEGACGKDQIQREPEEMFPFLPERAAERKLHSDHDLSLDTAS